MTRRAKVLKPDTILKNYWKDNGRFADLFNAVLFDGKPFIKPEELDDADTDESSILEHREFVQSIQASRDIIKTRKKSLAHGVEFVLLGKESQEHIHYAIPLRVMGYDYSTYKKQYDANARKYKASDGMTADEYLSRMKRTDKFYPVITVVVYYGEAPWDGAVTLHEMLHIPKEMAAFVNDYKIPLIEARQNSLRLHHADNVDLFQLLHIILDGSSQKQNAKEQAIEYCEKHQTDRSVIMAVAGATNTSINYQAFQKGEVTMCTLFDEIAKEHETKGRMEGRAEEIIESSYEMNLSEHDILMRLQKKLDISLQKAQEYFSRYAKHTI